MRRHLGLRRLVSRPAVGDGQADGRALRPLERVAHGHLEVERLARAELGAVRLDPRTESLGCEVDVVGKHLAVQLREPPPVGEQLLQLALLHVPRLPVTRHDQLGSQLEEQLGARDVVVDANRLRYW